MDNNLCVWVRLRIARRNLNPEILFYSARILDAKIQACSFYALNLPRIPHFKSVFAARCPRNFQCQLVSGKRPRLRKHPQPVARASERWQSKLLAQSKVIQQTNPQKVL